MFSAVELQGTVRYNFKMSGFFSAADFYDLKIKMSELSF